VTKVNTRASYRSLRLDALRAIAFFLVFCTHVKSISVLGKVGWIGVDLFFVLSGFLISGLLFTEINAKGFLDWKRFLVRRGFKIYPPFYVYTISAILIEFFIFDHLITRRELICELLWVQNYGWRFSGHTWSLAVEEHFYLVLPACLLFLLWLRRKSTEPLRHLPVLLLLLAGVILAGRSYTAYRGFWVYSHTHARADSLAAGVALSWFWHFRHDGLLRFVSRFRWPIALGVPVLVSPVLFFQWDGMIISSIGFTMIYLGFALLIALILILPTPRGLARSVLTPVAGLGVYSYSLYLWHPIVLKAVDGLGLPEGGWCFLVSLVANVIVGIGMALMVEVPFLRLRDRIFPGGSALLADSSRADRAVHRTTAQSTDAIAPGIRIATL
jgi:peptidoglycan/LPS O-acetylase OafA/YrhL